MKLLLHLLAIASACVVLSWIERSSRRGNNSKVFIYSKQSKFFGVFITVILPYALWEITDSFLERVFAFALYGGWIIYYLTMLASSYFIAGEFLIVKRFGDSKRYKIKEIVCILDRPYKGAVEISFSDGQKLNISYYIQGYTVLVHQLIQLSTNGNDRYSHIVGE
jgi:hypothetical protein